MISLLVIIVSSFNFGFTILALLRVRNERFYFHCFISIAIGLCVWIHLLFFLGLLGLFKPWLFSCFAVTSFVIAVTTFLARQKRSHGSISRLPALSENGNKVWGRGAGWLLSIPMCRAMLTGLWPVSIPTPMGRARLLQGITPQGRIYIAVIFLILLFTFIASFAPVTGGIRNDEICLHLSIVREWLNKSCIPELPSAISYQAGNAHLLFLLARALGSAASQRLISWLCFILCLTAIYFISRTFLDKNNSLIATLIAAINPLIFRSAWLGFIDLQSSLFVLLPVVTVLRYRHERQFGWVVLCSLFLGTGAGVKPTNFIYGSVFCISTLFFAFLKRVSLKEIISTSLCVILLGGALMIPWPIRTMELTGSPFFPPPLILYKNGDLKPLNGGIAPYSYEEVKGYYRYVVSRYGDYKSNLVNFIKFPWDITMKPERFQIGDSIGTIFLCLLPLVILLYPFPRTIFYLLAMSVFSAIVLYFCIAPEARYYIGILMFFCPLLAAIAQKLERNKILKFVAEMLIIINCLFSVMISIRILGPFMKAALSKEAAERMKRENIPYCEAFDFIKKNNISDITVVSTPQNLYYLPAKTRYHVDASLIAHMQAMHDQYVLDIDKSQTLERNLSLSHGDYAIPAHLLPSNAALVFKGPDALVYRFR